MDRRDWELLIRQYEAGATLEDIATQTALSENWVRHQIWRYSKDDAAARARHHLEAFRRRVARAIFHRQPVAGR
ncbi:hypothetical protein HXX25_07370 [Hyphobacterium sp. CCMP332]|uniref:hypothetical protein n=1 Tax=Hyphobacterium sp. CCMP332 TaxID=2749086 RepID=UPI00165040D7|nr:hypothetical protein [Hyphobacterium sp. CCMP332]QNL19142.1 hypothetical protein HXX25_07370 [Hyphobacterium sp. CCMP332]